MSESFVSDAVAPEPTPTDQNLLDRPDAVVLVIVAIMVAFWQLYLALLEDSTPNFLSGRSLAQRLGVDPSTISRRKDREDFHQWSQALDPEGIAWDYAEGGFWPQLDPGLMAQPDSRDRPAALDGSGRDRARS